MNFQTIDETIATADQLEKPVPGMVIFFAGGKPQCTAVPLDAKPVVLGRFAADDVVGIDDDHVSRRHTRVEQKDGGVFITDLESRNGTFVEGERVSEQTYAQAPRILRLGRSLLVFVSDVRLYQMASVEVREDEILGPVLRRVRRTVEHAALTGDSLLVSGPCGSGKELAARAFHAASGVKGAFVPVNCATIPVGLAERLLFGARKGTYSGAAADSEGHVQAAEGGTLFLDEVADLDLVVQPKLLRMLELHEVVRLGSSIPGKANVRVCAATLRDLRTLVQEGRFREDLYYRIGRPEIRLPALIEHLEDLPWLVARELERIDPRLTAHVLLLEACALRAWPGNIRELRTEIRSAAHKAIADGRTVVRDKDLADAAGHELAEASRPPTAPPISVASSITHEGAEAALRDAHGNVTRAARALGVHRNQLRRWIAKHHVDPRALGAPSSDDETDDTALNPPR